MVFIKRKENFICENCGIEVIGNGYTNHCPKCLWSKHVDIEPGDRTSECCGMMEPLYLDFSGGIFSVMHKCVKCGLKKKNITSPKDDTNVLIDNSKT